MSLNLVYEQKHPVTVSVQQTEINKDVLLGVGGKTLLAKSNMLRKLIGIYSANYIIKRILQGRIFTSFMV